MRIGDREIHLASEPYIIAELGVNHDGSRSRAMELVETAHHAGADAVKLQWFETERLLSSAARLAQYQQQAGVDDPFAMLRALELGPHEMKTIVESAHGLGLHTIVTVFSLELVGPADRLPWDAYKVASPDIINRPLIERLMSTGKPLLVSTGATDAEEIQSVTQWLGSYPHVLLQCVSAYPTPDESAALAGILALSDAAPVPLGYSDHTTATDTGALAVAAGASILEKHLTLDRSASGPDHATSLEPAQFAEYVKLARRAHAMLGDRTKRVLAIEQDVRAASRQSLVVTRRLEPGHVIARDDLTIKRPGIGIEPWRMDEIIGRRLARTVEADTPLAARDLETADPGEAQNTVTSISELGSR
ncbi:MAG: N-acetylneuraminate synthase family protein [Phycisphaerales bacterium]